jgi:hypothetical protein
MSVRNINEMCCHLREHFRVHRTGDGRSLGYVRDRNFSFLGFRKIYKSKHEINLRTGESQIYFRNAELTLGSLVLPQNG